MAEYDIAGLVNRLNEIDELVKGQEGKIKSAQDTIGANRKQADQLKDLYTAVFDPRRGYLVGAANALQNCDHSSTERSIDATFSAYDILTKVMQAYKVAGKIKDKSIRETFYQGLDEAAKMAYKAWTTGQQHLKTPKQKSARDAYMKRFQHAIAG